MEHTTKSKTELAGHTFSVSDQFNDNDSPHTELIDSDGGDIFGSLVLDKQDMSRMGKKQEMHRVFHQVSLLSFTAILMASWEWMLLANTQGLVDGGRAGLFWSYIWVFVGFGLTVASLAEMASMAPTCAGQYHWVSEFSPPEYQATLSYVTGWLSTLAWQCGNASGGFLAASMIQSLIGLRNPDYGFAGWQGTLLVLPVMAFWVVCNIWGSDIMPKIQNAFMIVHIGGFVGVVVVFCVLAPHVDAKTALLTFTNGGGWSTTSLSLMIGQISAVVALTAADAAAHMAEEVRDAGLSVPRAMMWTFLLNGLMGFVVLIAFIFCIPDIDAAINDESGFPVIYVFNLSMSNNGTLGMFILFFILILVGGISYQASTARQTFAFARDQGLPFSSWIGKINPRVNVPANAIILSATITFLLSLINIGNSSAFNAIISLSSVALMGTYCVSIGCLLHRRLTAAHLLPKARWNLGTWGVPVNAAALVWAGFTWFWMFWPNATPVTAESMNWAPVMFAGAVVWAIGYYLVKGRKVYVGPVASVKVM